MVRIWNDGNYKVWKPRAVVTDGVEPVSPDRLRAAFRKEQERNGRLREHIKEKTEAIRYLIKQLQAENQRISVQLDETRQKLHEEKEESRCHRQNVEKLEHKVSQLEADLESARTQNTDLTEDLAARTHYIAEEIAAQDQEKDEIRRLELELRGVNAGAEQWKKHLRAAVREKGQLSMELRRLVDSRLLVASGSKELADAHDRLSGLLYQGSS